MLDGLRSSGEGRKTKREIHSFGMGQMEKREREKGEQRTGTNVMFGGIL